MGVPGFFLWLYKKYKGSRFVFEKEKLSKKENGDLIKEINKIDYIMLDANSLVHPVCFKVLDDNPKLKDKAKLEAKMLVAVTEYIDKLVKYVDPKTGIYIAIDGVAPIAKIKQQRSRRFKSAQDRKLKANIKKKHKQDVPYFWNNSAITPGTEFMDKLTKTLIEYSKKQSVKVHFSSANTPSEGEHKILDFIKENKKFSYVIYGLDADLLFLAMAAQTDKIYLLRESVHLRRETFGSLSLVSIDVMKEQVVKSIKPIIKEELGDDELKMVPMDIDLINDFIFVCFLLGNDFLPHLPSIDISNKGLENILQAYSYTLVSFGGMTCIKVKNKKVTINQEFMKSLISMMSSQEELYLIENFSKKKRRMRYGGDDAYEKEMFRIENLMFKIDDPVQLGSDSHVEWRKRYYQHYFHTNETEIDKYAFTMSKEYFRGMVWVANYYFDTCPSWDWYYPYDHGPFMSDLSDSLTKISLDSFKFKKGKPIVPYVQLLCVLPPQSADLLPKSLQKIMLNSKSSLIHLYPTDFKQDFLNKNRYWQAIPHLPPLEIASVIHSYNKYKSKLSKNELERTKMQKVYQFN